MNYREESIDTLKFLFGKLLGQRGDAQWIETSLEECAGLMIDINYNDVIQYKHHSEVVEYFLKHEKRKVDKRLKNQKRRHDYKHNFRNKDWLEAIEYFDFRCAYCGSDDKMTIDHFTPFSKGGELVKENIIPACARCNSSKNNRDFEDWFETQGFYDKEQKQKIYEFLEK